jgi:hypothetical protein
MPTIVDRAGWGAKPPKGPLTPWADGQPTGWIVHWAGVPITPHDHSLCDDGVRQDQNYHQSGEYTDVAYNFLVCIHGTIYEGRGFDYRSAANGTGGANQTHLSVQFHGGPGTPFTDEAKAAIKWLIKTAGPAAARTTVIPHRAAPEVATACPGDEITNWISAGMPVAGTSPQPSKPTPPKKPYGDWPTKNKPLIKRGSTGDLVRYAQRVLKDKAAQKITADGAYGPKTEAAVRNLQKVAKLPADGKIGRRTWAVIDKLARS